MGAAPSPPRWGAWPAWAACRGPPGSAASPARGFPNCGPLRARARCSGRCVRIHGRRFPGTPLPASRLCATCAHGAVPEHQLSPTRRSSLVLPSAGAAAGFPPRVRADPDWQWVPLERLVGGLLGARAGLLRGRSGRLWPPARGEPPAPALLTPHPRPPLMVGNKARPSPPAPHGAKGQRVLRAPGIGESGEIGRHLGWLGL